MWVPGHYIFLAAVMFIVESSIIFVYTTIGLMKANPMPFILPASVFPYQCQHPLFDPALIPGNSADDGSGAAGGALVRTLTTYETIVIPNSARLSGSGQTAFESALVTSVDLDNKSTGAPSETSLTTSTWSNAISKAGLPFSSSIAPSLVTAMILVTTTLPASSLVRPTITVTEIVEASAS